MSHAKICKSFLRVARARKIQRDEMWEPGEKVSLKDRFVFCLSPHTTHCEQNYFLPDSKFFTRCTHMSGKICVLDGVSDLLTADQSIHLNEFGEFVIHTS